MYYFKGDINACIQPIHQFICQFVSGMSPKFKYSENSIKSTHGRLYRDVHGVPYLCHFGSTVKLGNKELFGRPKIVP